MKKNKNVDQHVKWTNTQIGIASCIIQSVDNM